MGGLGTQDLTDLLSPETISLAARMSHLDTQPPSISASWTTLGCLKGVLGLSSVVDCALAHVQSAD